MYSIKLTDFAQVYQMSESTLFRSNDNCTVVLSDDKNGKLVIPNGSRVHGPGYSPADTVDGVLNWFLIQLKLLV